MQGGGGPGGRQGGGGCHRDANTGVGFRLDPLAERRRRAVALGAGRPLSDPPRQQEMAEPGVQCCRRGAVGRERVEHVAVREPVVAVVGVRVRVVVPVHGGRVMGVEVVDLRVAATAAAAAGSALARAEAVGPGGVGVRQAGLGQRVAGPQGAVGGVEGQGADGGAGEVWVDGDGGGGGGARAGLGRVAPPAAPHFHDGALGERRTVCKTTHTHTHTL